MVDELEQHYAKLYADLEAAGGSDEELAKLDLQIGQAIETACTEFVQKQANERTRIRDEQAAGARQLLEQTRTAEQGFFDGLN